MLLGLIFIVIAYVVGSLSSAVLVCKIMGLPDPRIDGSGNPGATNVLRISGKKPALLVLLGDALKGFLPVVLATICSVSGFGLALVALAAVVGHIFPVFFKFKGGKGVATAAGTLLALSLGTALVVFIVWGAILFFTRYVSLASLVGCVLAAVLILFVHPTYFLPLAAMAGLIIWRHTENLERLKSGTENKIEF